MPRFEPIYRPHGLLPVAAQEMLVRAARRDDDSIAGEYNLAVETAVSVAIKKVRTTWPEYFRREL